MQEWSREKLEDVLNNNEVVLIYLYTPMCGTCQLASKMLSIAGEVLFEYPKGKIDLNYQPEIAERWKIESVPCLLIFNKGKLNRKIYAFHSVPDLIENIKSTLKES